MNQEDELKRLEEFLRNDEIRELKELVSIAKELLSKGWITWGEYDACLRMLLEKLSEVKL